MKKQKKNKKIESTKESNYNSQPINLSDGVLSDTKKTRLNKKNVKKNSTLPSDERLDNNENIIVKEKTLNKKQTIVADKAKVLNQKNTNLTLLSDKKLEGAEVVNDNKKLKTTIKNNLATPNKNKLTTNESVEIMNNANLDNADVDNTGINNAEINKNDHIKKGKDKSKLTCKQRKERRKEKRLQKSQAKDLTRYGLKPNDVNDGYNTPTNKSKNRHDKKSESKKSWQALKRCLIYFKGHRWGLVLVIFLALIFATGSLLDAIITERMITYMGLADLPNVIKYAVLSYLVYIIIRFGHTFWAIIISNIVAKVVKKLQIDLIDNVSRTKTSKFDSVNSGSIISRINSDTDAVVEGVDSVIDHLTDVIIAIAYTAYFFYINIWLGIFMVAYIFLLSIFDNGYQKNNYKMTRKYRVLNDKNIGLVSEIARGIRDIKNLNIRKNAQEKFSTNAEHMKNVTVDKIVGNTIWWTSRAILQLTFELVVIILGIYLLVQGQITLGALIVVIFYKGKAASLIEYFSRIRESLNNSKVSAERISEILNETDYPKEKFGNITIKEPQGAIEFKDVAFKYNNGAVVFENLNLKIEPNQSTAFVGKSGQGKSTLLNLIPRLYDVTSGSVCIDGVDVKQLSEDGLRELVTVVPQAPYIFNTTLRENLKYVQDKLSDEEMIAACKKAQIHDFIISKEQGYDCVVGENGLILSGGQRQRLAIARALLKKSKIVLLDEATSALDNENQKRIQDVINGLTIDHTVLVVAHRLSTVINCDRIIMIENGKIIAQGKHKEMMRKCPEYKGLYKIEQEATDLQATDLED